MVDQRKQRDVCCENKCNLAVGLLCNVPQGETHIKLQNGFEIQSEALCSAKCAFEYYFMSFS